MIYSFREERLGYVGLRGEVSGGLGGRGSRGGVVKVIIGDFVGRRG